MNITTKFSLGQKVYVVLESYETNYDKLVVCKSCNGLGTSYPFDSSGETYEAPCPICEGDGKAFEVVEKASVVYGKPWSLRIYGRSSAPKVEYVFDDLCSIDGKSLNMFHSSKEEDVFATEAEALAKCKELNNEQT